jgi:enoyl-CoA hydratase/carnithine racemase
LVKVGQTGDYAGAWTIARWVVPAQASELFLLSERLDADAAARIGHVTEIVDDAAWLGRVASVATMLASRAQLRPHPVDLRTL